MTRIVAQLAFLAALAVFPLGALADDRPEFFAATGTVTKVYDGDTLDVATPMELVRVRVNGIDAPERRQAYSRVSRVALTDLVKGKSADLSCSKIDRYGRRVCTVTVAGEDVALEMIRKGLAWHFKRYAHEQPEKERAAYEAAEEAAKKSERGLWQAAQPMAPWDFRAAQRPQSLPNTAR